MTASLLGFVPCSDPSSQTVVADRDAVGALLSGMPDSYAAETHRPVRGHPNSITITHSLPETSNNLGFVEGPAHMEEPRFTRKS